ncbi:hypothetical protein [uncultured Maribacter sp.]|uniref:hypothetical protein n=1 Tax=uncultured Maribacter sp. TaxID=431308 RepID=UPI00262CF6EE|nr:hypothetical protein [uncultured Maribacter sp.]
MDKVLSRFTEILCGTLDNAAQIEVEKKAGKQVHPYAKHVTDVFSHRVVNRPKNHDGIYVLEESYYTYPNKETEVKPLLFYLRSDGKSKVFLQSVQIPLKYKAEEATNANTDFILDYKDLEFRPFGIAEYTLMETDEFTVNHIGIVGPGMTFQLTETLSDEGLSVMEILKIDGVVMTPYDTPIHYKPITIGN